MFLNCGVGEDSCKSFGLQGVKPVNPKGNHAWKIPWTEDPGRLQSVGLQRVGHD